MTLKKVNKELAKLGDIELVKGNGYFYFWGNDIDTSKEGVYVNSLNELSMEAWIEEAKTRLKES